MREVQVPLGSRSYQIKIGQGVLQNLGREARSLELNRRCAIITDRNVAPLLAPAAIYSLKKAGFDPVVIKLPAGEKTKSLAQASWCYSELGRHRLERNSFVVALGGGVIGDLAGFVAATYLRGIPFIQVPTTLLAQVDSSVGGKVGVNLPSGKNLVGAFHQPRLVLCEINALCTLPDREFRAGLAEVIKYGIIHDASLFDKLEKEIPALAPDSARQLEELVSRSCKIKAEVVSQDETESGLRAILNFGHTLGHALEAVFGYRKYLHGEAIAIGQVWAARLSQKRMGLDQTAADRIESLFRASGLPTAIQLSSLEKRKVLKTMGLDKKVSGGEIGLVLVPRLGEARFGQKVSLKELNDFLPGKKGRGKE